MHRFKLLHFTLALTLSAAFNSPRAEEEDANLEEAVVEWSHDRCEYILIKKADGFGIITQFSAERLKPGDAFRSDLGHSVNSGKKFINKATGETGMLRGTAFGLTRAQALKKIHGICRKYAPAE